MEQEGRIKWIDHVRAIAMISIVLGHALGQLDSSNILKDWLYLFHVPLCIAISGYLFKDKQHVRDSLLQIKKLLFRLYIPYLFWGALSILVYLVVIERGNWHNALQYLIGLFYGNGSLGVSSTSEGLMIWNRPLWYLPCIFMIEVAASFMSLIRIKYKNLIFCILFIVLGVVCYRFLQPHALFMEIESAVYLMPFFWLGALIRENEKSIQKLWNKRAIGIVTALVMIASGTAVGFLNGMVSYLSETYGKYYGLFILSAVLICVGMILLERSINYRCKVLTYIGQNTLVILVTHKFVLVACAMVLKKFMNPTGFIVVVAISLAVTAIAVAAALLAGMLFSRFLPILIGKPRKRNARVTD